MKKRTFVVLCPPPHTATQTNKQTMFVPLLSLSLSLSRLMDGMGCVVCCVCVCVCWIDSLYFSLLMLLMYKTITINIPNDHTKDLSLATTVFEPLMG